MRRELSGSELAGWMAYFDLEPPGKTAWQRTAMGCLTAARIAGNSKVSLEDFMPAYAPAEQAPEDMIATLRKFTVR